ncbi:KxYKxGKxW signal peptide domain-containing protein [Paucilactobacillus suebicus]|uniref:Mucus-binding protein n=1 Tax=Paucilactobacillus suebicus DSM 5007 = KCTC 3549 TaxID=1423807 RepID=A0A0R1W1J5_9LACO|nr:KxYKxGKxW signal peptide domain-containing protein [Paucilactobacillus suebicus]KRM11736.1 mucus-binding protein [Paucilactobacillus suebicus DSM 5007 = KCTC 3549]
MGDMKNSNHKLAEEDETVRFKLYKAGKLWLVSGITTLSVGLLWGGSAINAHADTTTATTPTSAAVTNSQSTSTASESSATSSAASLAQTSAAVASTSTNSQSAASASTATSAASTKASAATRVMAPAVAAASSATSGSPEAASSADYVTSTDSNGNYSVNPDQTGLSGSAALVAVSDQNMSDYFTAVDGSGDTLPINGNTAQLTNGYKPVDENNYSAGTGFVVSDQQVDFTTDFNLDVSISATWDPNMGSWLGGDGAAVFFEKVSPDQVATNFASGSGFGISNNVDNDDVISFNVSTNALGISPTGETQNQWVLYESQKDTTTPLTGTTPIETGIGISNDESGSITYTFNIAYNASTKVITTTVYDQNGNELTQWEYNVPDSWIGQGYTLAATGNTAASVATYTATINSYSYEPAKTTLNITSSGFPAGVTGPSQSSVAGIAGSVIAFYPAGTTAPTTDADGNAVTTAIAVASVGDYHLAADQFITLDANSANNDVVLAYTPTLTITYVDDETGETVKTTTDDAVNNEVDWTADAPTGYQLAENQAASGIYTFTSTDGNGLTIHLTHAHTQTTVTSTNTVHYTGLPDSVAAANDVTDSVTTVDWIKDVDDVTGDTTYNTANKTTSVTSPTVPGYTASSSVVTFTNGGTTDTPQNKSETVTYTADPQTATVEYVDDDNNGAIVGTPTTISGVTDGTATWNTNNKPAGYVLSAGQDASGTYTFTSDGSQVIKIHLSHHIVDTTKTTTRTIKYVVDGDATAPAEVVQTAVWKIETDEATGQSVATMQNEYSSVVSPTLDGYTPDIATVKSQYNAPTSDLSSLTNSEVTVTYSANKGSDTGSGTGNNSGSQTPGNGGNGSQGSSNAGTTGTTGSNGGSSSTGTGSSTTKLDPVTTGVTSASSTSSKTITPNKTTAKQTKSNQKLPQTGDDASAAAALSTMGIVMGMFGVTGLRRRKRQ